MTGNSAALDLPGLTAPACGRLRPTVRVLLLDDAGQALLFAAIDTDGERFWFPPGGGALPGEPALITAARELHEETGLVGIPIGPELWRRRVVARLQGEVIDFRERWFLARVPPFTIDTTGFEAFERSMIIEHRWWSPAALAATGDRLVPPDLAALVAGLLRDGPPATPLLFPDTFLVDPRAVDGAPDLP